MSSPFTKTVVFYIVPDFTMLAFTSAMEALRLANAVQGAQAYRWRVVSGDGLPVKASCGLTITPDGSIAAEKAKPNADRAHMVVVCAGWHVERAVDRSAAAWLRWTRNAGTTIAGICTGAYLLADAGLLAGKRCTIHWENLPVFKEKFPAAIAGTNLIECDSNIYTCAGGAASFDLMLHFIEHEFGRRTSLAVCEQAIFDRIRPPSERQRSLVRTLGNLNPLLLAAVEFMEDAMAEHASIEAVARHIKLSRRQMERMFAKELATSPSRFYLELRLDRARLMILQSGMAIIDVAVACGFVSSSHFTKCYREHYGVSPNKMRLKGPRSAQLQSLADAP
ncbi:GlxA family transcriptional regulator [Rhizobium mesoamericanum]|uniref:Transcriptional regulator, AraC family n=1 Tax=Rhizobium mesoamericanum STM3625 TaxID=1211777 RepID=K0Q2M1_9HYPH|nr:GlxA family transcriptional regulator [Rhizobium mesoamericanum]CCM78805.1 Transcriptional regulator, AraC family [Rhizobium mesoamericanum STM3625]